MSEEPKQKTTAVKATNTARKVRQFVKTMYTRAAEAKAEGKPVAFCMMACGLDEILLAMDITPIYTENYAGLCAAKRDADRFLRRAEADGYANEICSYVRTGIGFEAIRRELGDMPPNAPDGGMVEPDLLLGCSCVCDPRYKWYQSLGHYVDIPTYCHDVVAPPFDADYREVTPYYIRYATQQLRGLIQFLENQTGNRMDYDRLKHHVGISSETLKIWWETDQLRKAIPSPMPSEDHFSIFVPGTFRLGEEETLDFYRELYAEVKERVENKVGVIEDEKYRVMWAGGLPPWHTMWMFNYFESQGAVFAIEDAYFPWEPHHIPEDIEDPVEHIATKQYRVLTNLFEEAKRNTGNPKVERLLRMVKEYSIDGLVSHGTRSCRANTIGQIHLNASIQKHLRIPFLNLVSDMVDLRDYSEAQWRMQIDSFMDTVKARKQGE